MRIEMISALIGVFGTIIAGLIVLFVVLVNRRRTSRTLDEFTKPLPEANAVVVAELIAKLTPTFVAVIAGTWILYQYRVFQAEQNQVTMQITKNQVERAKIEQLVAERQAQIHGLDIQQKSALHVQTVPKLSIDIL